jgi:hypothetical protein
VWAAWPQRSPKRVVVSYTRGTEWSPSEQAADSVGVPKGIAADAAGRVYVLFRTTAGRLFSVCRTERPGVQEQSPKLTAVSHTGTIVRGVLFLKACGTRQTAYGAELLDISGRKALDLHAGPNDVSRLAPGIYFVTEHGARCTVNVHKVVIQR